jgi:hypothetical protein
MQVSVRSLDDHDLQSFSSFRSLQDSDLPDEYFVATDSPRPDHGSLSLEKAADIQPLDWRMPCEDTEAPAKKKRNVGKKTSEKLARGPPPFELVDCSNPSELDKQMVFDAVRSLKQRNGERFIKEPEKMIQIQECDINNFLTSVVLRGFNREGILGMNESSSAASTTKSFRQDRTRQAVKHFLLATSEVAKFQSQYADQVMAYSSQSIRRVIQVHIEGSSAERNTLRMKYFDYLLTLLPLYLFYVDMINAIIPETGLNGHATIEAQRSQACQQFLQHASEQIIQNDFSIRNQPNLYDAPGGKYHRKFDNPSPFLWNIIRDWIASSRKKLASQIIDQHNDMNRVFKQFFNEILASFMDHVSQRSAQISALKSIPKYSRRS